MPGKTILSVGMTTLIGTVRISDLEKKLIVANAMGIPFFLYDISIISYRSIKFHYFFANFLF